MPWLAAVLVACAVGFAGRGAATDSITVDEPSHLVAGYASLSTGDRHLSPDHPPLGRMLLAFPLLAKRVSWQAEGTTAWAQGDFFTLGRSFLEDWNDGRELVLASRSVAIAVLLALLLTLFVVARGLFGEWGGLLTMAVAAFDPAFLAHGHLATLDVPFCLAALLTLAAADRWLERPSRGRLGALALSFAASSLIKFSWFALVPALLGMAVVARRKDGAGAVLRAIARATWAIAAVAFIATWAIYGFRFDAREGAHGDAATMHVLGDAGMPLPMTRAAAWESVLHDSATARDRPGLVVPLLRWAHSLRLLPEAYLYGIAYVGKNAETRGAYLRGNYSMRGFPNYFPWAFAIKTPLPTLALFLASALAGLVALLRRRPPPGLVVGLTLFAAAYAATLVSSNLNIGYRHLLPVVAVLTVLTGSLGPLCRLPRARRPVLTLVLAALLGLVCTTWSASPHLLGFFNSSMGGWRNGHLYLADSNLDWGQDLRRLADRLRSEPQGAAVWLSQAGDPPRPRHLRVSWLLGDGSHTPSPGAIAGGLFVISATDLLGVYRPLARSSSWRDPRLARYYETLASSSGRQIPGAGDLTIDDFEGLRRLRLISRLALRQPDERIGTSLFLYRLSDDQVAEATEP